MNKRALDWMRAVRRLEAVYAQGGRAALEKLTGTEAYLLYEEKAVALLAAEKMLAAQPGHERWQLRRDYLQVEVEDIEGWLKERVWPFNERILDGRGPPKELDREFEP
jgi:hypothetical protein